MKNILLASATCFLLTLSSPAQQHRFNVSFDVVGPASVKADIESYLGRELRSLGDVDLVTKNADEEIHVVVLQDESVGGHSLGWSVAVGTAYGSVCNVAGKTQPCMVFDSLYLLGGSELREICSRAVTKFDQGDLEPIRKLLK